MNVLEDMICGNSDLHASELRPPEEVPVFFDLEIFIPADGLQNVSIRDEAVANVMTTSNRLMTS